MIKKFESFKTGVPELVLKNITEIKVYYINFNGALKTGSIECNKKVADDLENILEEILRIHFPIKEINPISKYNNDDMESVKANNTSCFNYRFVIGSDKISDHATGNAIDINPFQNPWVHPAAHKIEGRKYDPEQIGTVTKEVVDIFKKYGWKWGGEWKSPDYQHFFKPDMDLKTDILSILNEQNIHHEFDPYGEEEWGDGYIYRYRDIIHEYGFPTDDSHYDDGELYGFTFKILSKDVHVFVSDNDGIDIWCGDLMGNSWLNRMKLRTNTQDNRLLKRDIDKAVDSYILPLKEQINLDPYGEERWDDRDNIEIIREIAVNLNLNPTEIKEHSRYIKEFIFTVDYPHRGILYYYVIDDLRENVTTMTIRFGVPNHMIKVLRELTEREFIDAYTDLAEQLKPNYS